VRKDRRHPADADKLRDRGAPDGEDVIGAFRAISRRTREKLKTLARGPVDRFGVFSPLNRARRGTLFEGVKGRAPRSVAEVRGP